MTVAVCDIESHTSVDNDTTHKQQHITDNMNELDDEQFERWTLKLFNDSSNTRSYICLTLVKVAGLLEDESYHKMVQAHKHGEAIIGEYCQEHADHYKEALLSSGLVCEIYPVEE